jgi:hypothetical protein
MGKIERIEVPPEDRERLERLVRDRNTPQKIVWRSRIVLVTGEGIGAGRVVEGRDPPARAQAVDGEEDQASRELDTP